ncbi:RNA polymerase sigma factor [Chitinophaga lutea]
MRDYKNITDTDLLAMLQDGDRSAFAEIHHRYAPLLFRHAMGMLRDKSAAADALQDIFVVLWEKRSELIIRTSLAAYIYGITRFTLLGYIRKTSFARGYLAVLSAEMQEETQGADRSLLEKELAERIEAEVDMLPEKMKAIFRLSRSGGYSYKDISRELQVTEHTVRKQVSNALRILRIKLHRLFF